jgi:uncharacterized protein YfaQ (DUF2300 family)
MRIWMEGEARVVEKVKGRNEPSQLEKAGRIVAFLPSRRARLTPTNEAKRSERCCRAGATVGEAKRSVRCCG